MGKKGSTVAAAAAERGHSPTERRQTRSAIDLQGGNMKKRYLALILTLEIGLAAVGCSKKSSDDAGAAETAATAAEAAVEETAEEAGTSEEAVEEAPAEEKEEAPAEETKAEEAEEAEEVEEESSEEAPALAGETITFTSAHNYKIQLPASWEGRYDVATTDDGDIFICRVADEGDSGQLFTITYYVEDEYWPGQKVVELPAIDNGQNCSYVALIPEGQDFEQTEEKVNEYNSMAADVNAILGTFSAP